MGTSLLRSFPGPDNKETFLKLNVAMRTDFALSNPSLSPSSPKDGDPVTFSVALTALSSTIPYTQKLSEMVIASVDGVKIGTMFLNYAGPTGTSIIVSTTSPWTATGGAHTIKWHLIIMYDDPNLVLIDPDLTNNEVSLSFSVTTSETTTAIISETTATTTSQTTSTISPSILGYPLESTTIGLALIAICGIVIAAVLMMRRMRKGTGKAKTTTTSAPTKFCLNCGKTMAPSAMYCGNCGAKQE